MRTTWIVQANVEAESTSPMLLRRACAAEGRDFVEVSVTPGGPLPELPRVEGPVVFHGRATLILRAFEHPQWRQGVFFDPERFQHRAYSAAWGERMLNADARILSWEELLREPLDPDARVFLKPNDDLKRFTGQAEILGVRPALCGAEKYGPAHRPEFGGGPRKDPRDRRRVSALRRRGTGRLRKHVSAER